MADQDQDSQDELEGLRGDEASAQRDEREDHDEDLDEDSAHEDTPSSETHDAAPSPDGGATTVTPAPPPESPSPAPMPRGWRLALQLALPPVLTAGAVGVHWAVNVPDKIEVSSKDQGAEKAAPDKKAPRKRKPKSRAKASEEVRDQEELERAWEAWNAKPFDDEPVRSSWARRHQTLISRAFVEARTSAFSGAEEPGIMLASQKCRTIRCQFLVRTPFAHELEVIDTALAGLQSDEAPLWRQYSAERIDPPEGEPPEQHYLSVTVAFHADDVDATTIAAAAAAAVKADAGSDGKAG